MDIKSSDLKRKVIKSGIIAVLVIGIAAVLYFMGVKAGKSKGSVVIDVGDDTTVTVDLLESTIKSASDLVTTKYHYKDAMTVKRGEEKSVFGIKYGTEEMLVMYGGIVSVGYDVNDIAFDVDDGSKKITVKLPQPKIVSHEIDDKDFKVYDTEKSIFADVTMEDVIQDREQAKEEQQKELLNDPEFMSTVKMNTENVLRAFLNLIIGDSGYTIAFE